MTEHLLKNLISIVERRERNIIRLINLGMKIKSGTSSEKFEDISGEIEEDTKTIEAIKLIIIKTNKNE